MRCILRVIAGCRRGLTLYSLEGDNTRPTLDRVKETMFNVLNVDIAGKNCLDVFSGTGALSIEAISRGATLAYLIDNNKESIDVINKNIEKAKFSNECKVIKGNFEDVLKNIANTDIKFSIVFLDPPYDSMYYERVLNMLHEYNLLNDDAIIVCEHRKNVTITNNYFTVYKEKSFSKTKLSFLEINEV